MSNIINSIIEIDSIAQKRLNDAHLFEANIKNVIAEKKLNTNELIAQKAEMRVAKINELEKQYADDEMASIKEESDAKIALLEQLFEDNHEQQELEIFNNIIK